MIQEIFGVNPFVRGVADALAADGYLAVAPDLFWRIEPGVDITDQSKAEWDKAFSLYNAFDVDLGVKDIDSTIDAIRADDGCSGKVGSVGFCLGGLLAFLTATRTDVDAAVGYYGVGIEKYTGEADQIEGALMLHIAQADGFVGSVWLDPSPLCIGAPFKGRITLGAAPSRRAQEVRLELRVKARATVSGGRNETITMWSGVIAGAGAFGGAQTIEFAGELPTTWLPTIQTEHGRSDAAFHVIIATAFARDPHLVRDVAICSTTEL